MADRDTLLQLLSEIGATLEDLSAALVLAPRLDADDLPALVPHARDTLLRLVALLDPASAAARTP